MKEEEEGREELEGEEEGDRGGEGRKTKGVQKEVQREEGVGE